MLCDCHVHSAYSDDSFYPMKDVITDAIALGLDEICFTDHVDYGIKKDWDDRETFTYRDGKPLANVDYDRYFKEIKTYQDFYKDKINIKAGLEFGIQVHTISAYEKLFKKWPLDFVILSVHQVEDKEFWEGDYQRGKTQKEYIEGYYNEILNCAMTYKDYSVLGHLDHIVRYDQNGIYPFEKIEELIASILKVAIRDDKGLEFNTSYVRYGLKDTTPSIAILKLYRDLGGKIITIGSDSHKKEHLGFKIRESKELLWHLGFKEYCTYKDMRPLFHPLDD